MFVGMESSNITIEYNPLSATIGKVTMATDLAFFTFKKIIGMKYPKGINNKIEPNNQAENKLESLLPSTAGTGPPKISIINNNDSTNIPANTVVLFR